MSVTLSETFFVLVMMTVCFVSGFGLLKVIDFYFKKKLELLEKQREQRKEQNELVERVIISAFDAIRTASAEDRARADGIRMQSKVEIDAYKRDLESDSVQEISDQFESASVDDDQLVRHRMRIETPDGHVLEPVFPGDRI